MSEITYSSTSEDTSQKKTSTFSISETAKSKLNEIANSQNRSMSNMLEILINSEYQRNFSQTIQEFPNA